MSDFFRQHRTLGSRERHTLAETTYAVLRERLLYQHLAQSGKGELPRRLALLAWQGNAGFLRAALRTLAQARMRDNIGPETPLRLTRWSDGTVSLDDPTTGRAIGLDAFGADNAGAFAQLFKKREETK